MAGFPEGLKSYLRVPFVMIVWFMETYAKNTARLRIFMKKPRVAMAFKLAITFTVLLWVVVAMVASEDDKNRFTDTLKSFWGEMQDLNQQKKEQTKNPIQ